MNRKKQHRQPSSPEPLLGQLIVLDLPARAGEGEDSLSFDFRRDVGFMAVCDGCGGLGARRYPAFGQHTGAYVAARVAAQTVFDRFGELAAAQPSALTQPQALARALEDALRFRLEELQALRRSDRVFLPQRIQSECDEEYRLWKRAVSRAADWIEH